MTYKNIIITLVMLSIVAIAIWATLMTYTTVNVPLLRSNTSQPDAFMEDVVAMIMDKEGKPKLTIVTPKMVHFPEQDTTELTQPKLTVYRHTPQPWYISSKYGKAIKGIEHLNFWENVTIHHPADESNPNTVIKTTTLTVFPNKQTAETKDAITLIQPHLTIQATGMQADMNIGNIKLLSHSRGMYVPDL